MKIYNEIVIDMNPDSSSYGETLHEDSFEYNGPMMKMFHSDIEYSTSTSGTTEDAVALQNTKGYIRHQTFDGFYLMERSVGGTQGLSEWVIYDDDLNIRQEMHGSGYGDALSWEQAVNRVRDWQVRAADPDFDQQQEILTTAPDVHYEDFIKYINKEGDVIDPEGFKEYLRTLPGMNKSDDYLDTLISNMPNLNVSEADLATGKRKYESDVYDITSGISNIHTKLGEQREEITSTMGESDIYSPTSTGFGGDESITEGLYGDISEAGRDIQGLATGEDYYGLGEEKEQSFVDWLAKHAG